MSASIDRRSASARPMRVYFLSSSKVLVMRWTVASELTAQRASPGIEECPSHTRRRLSIARRKHHPLGIEFELRDLGRREQAVVIFAGFDRRRQDQRRLGLGRRQHLGLASEQTVRGEVDNTRSCQAAVARKALAFSPR
jgi:hypothetical protein